MNIDRALDKVGKWGRYQSVLYTLIFFAGIPNAFITIYFSISHHEIQHSCKLPETQENHTTNITSSDSWHTALNYTIPLELDKRGNMQKSKCYLKKMNYSAPGDMANHVNQTHDLIACTDGWNFETLPGETSPIVEFSFICDDDWKSPVTISLFQIGVMIGSFVGAVADLFGRRPLFLLAAFGQVLAMGLIAISWNYYAYATFQFLCGGFALINYFAAFVVGTEIIAPEWRNFLSIASFYSFSVGYVMVPGLAYLIPNWRTFYWAAMLISAAVYLPSYWLFPESPRWLITKGRTSDSLKVLKKISKMNGLDVDFVEDNGNEISEMKALKKQDDNNKFDVKSNGSKNSLWILLRSSIKWRCLASIFGWFTSCIVYYAVSYHSTSFSKDKYLNCFFCGLSEFPSYIIAFYLVNIIGRPRSAMIFMFLTGFSCIALPFIHEDSSIALTIISMLGKGGISAVFYVYYLISTEIAPTPQRSTNICICSSIGRIGSFLAPYLAYAGKIHFTIPSVPMGVLAVICGIITVAFVPETAGIEMPDTLEESLSNNRFYGFNIFRRKFEARKIKKSATGNLLTSKEVLA